MTDDEITLTEERARLEIAAQITRKIIPGIMDGGEEGKGRGESVLAGLSSLFLTAYNGAGEALEVVRRSSANYKPLPMSLRRAIQDAERVRIACEIVNALSVVTEPAAERLAWLAGNRASEPDKVPGWAMSLCVKLNEARRIADNRLRDEVAAHEFSK